MFRDGQLENLHPQSVLTDYEIGAIRAFEEVFPQTGMQGCFFITWHSVFGVECRTMDLPSCTGRMTSFSTGLDDTSISVCPCGRCRRCV